MRIGILISIYPRTAIRHSSIELVWLLIDPLLGILAHLLKKLVISPWLIGGRSGIPALLGGVESSHERDVTIVLGSPRGVSAPKLVPTGLKITAPHRG